MKDPLRCNVAHEFLCRHCFLCFTSRQVFATTTNGAFVACILLGRCFEEEQGSLPFSYYPSGVLTGAVEALRSLGDLNAAGVLTDAEFATAKARVLAQYGLA